MKQRIFMDVNMRGNTNPRSFFIRKFFLSGLVFFLGCGLNGCALLGLLLRLAPVAAAVLVEYSQPVNIEEGRILCVKALRYVEIQGEDSRIVKNEYFLVLLDGRGTEIASEQLSLGGKYYKAEKFDIAGNNEKNYVLVLTDENWSKEIGCFTTLSCQLAAEY